MIVIWWCEIMKLATDVTMYWYKQVSLYRVLGPELIQCTGSQPANDFFKVIPGGRLALLSIRPAYSPRKHAPDGATTDWGGEHLIAAHYSFTGWLTFSGRFTHISGHPSAEGRACDRESSLAKGRRSITVLRHRPHILVMAVNYLSLAGVC